MESSEIQSSPFVEPAHFTPDNGPAASPLAGSDAAALGQRLTHALSRLLAAGDAAASSAIEGELAELLDAYTDALKRDGQLPEHVIIAVRNAVISAPVENVYSFRRSEALGAAAVQRCIHRYFDDEGLASEPGSSGERPLLP